MIIARELVERLLDQAARDGAVMALLLSDMSREHQPPGFDIIAMTRHNSVLCNRLVAAPP